MTSTFQASDVEEMIALMEQWNIAEVHLHLDDAELDIVRASRAAQAAAPALPEAPPLTPAPREAGKEAELVHIFAPVVGVFHLAARGFPNGSPQPGDQVQAGQIIGSIELMHLPTDMISPVSGVIEGILAEDGAGVEYAQPLLVIRPFEEVGEDEAGMLPPPIR